MPTSINQANNVKNTQTTTTAKTTNIPAGQMAVPIGQGNKQAPEKISFVEQNFNKDLESGKLKKHEHKVEFLGIEIKKKTDLYLYTPSKGESFADISKHYGLAKGALGKAAWSHGFSGNIDICKPTKPILIEGKDIRAAIEARK